MDDATRDMIMAMVVWGDGDEVAAQLTDIVALGVDGFTLSLPANGWIPERVEQLGDVASKVLAAR